jgi:phosphate starvation-inducible PhoH-like protein
MAQREPEPLPKSASDSPSLAPSRKLDRDMQIVVILRRQSRASALVGQYGQNLALIERRLGVVAIRAAITSRIAGSRDGCDAGAARARDAV